MSQVKKYRSLHYIGVVVNNEKFLLARSIIKDYKLKPVQCFSDCS